MASTHLFFQDSGAAKQSFSSSFSPASLAISQKCVHAISDLRAKLLQIRQLAKGQQQLAAKPHVQKIAETRMHIGHFQQCNLAKLNERLLHRCS
jgi:hypothetical protein